MSPRRKPAVPVDGKPAARSPVKRRRRVCDIHGLEFVTVIYGFPVQEAFEAAERGEVVLAGCMVWPGMPRFACPVCGVNPPDDQSPLL
jgi:hypothetical protein